jgi:PAS domain S-box-containing protein
MAERLAELEAELEMLRARVRELEAAAAEPRATESPADARLRAVLQHCPDMIFVKDVEGRFQEVSQSLLVARNVTREQVIGHHETDIYPVVMAERFQEQDAVVRASGEAQMFEETFEDLSGRVTTWIAHKFPLESGEIAGIATEITARKAQENDARRTADRLRLVVEGTGIGPYEVNMRTGLGTWSPSAFRLLGYEPTEDLIGTFDMWRAVVHPDDLEEALAAHANPEQKLGHWRLHHRIITPRGEIRWLTAYGQFVERDGDIMAIGIALDVTEQRAMEAALHAGSARLQLALDAAHMAVWEYVTGSDAIDGSPEFARLFGIPEGGRLSLAEAHKRTEPEDWMRLGGAAMAAMERGERYFEAEFRYHCPDGEQRWFLLRGEIDRPVEGAVRRTIGVVLDITTRKSAEEALAERESELRAALHAGALAVTDLDHVAGVFRPSPQLNLLYGFPLDHQLTVADVRTRYHPAHAETIQLQRKADETDTSRMTFRWEMRLLLPGGGDRWVEGFGEYFRDEAGVILRSRGIVMDVTERVLMERHQRLLMAELNHRVKNTLAIVQGLAHQTFRSLGLAEEASNTFEGRLEALSRAHNLLTRENWDSADMRDIVEGALITHGGLTERCTIQGPRMRLQPKPAVTLALALHELATNATKYGALSTPGGRIDVIWRVTAGAEPRLIIEWRESGGPPVTPPQRTGFGTRMIERALATELRATAKMNFDPAGLICTIDAPLPPLAPEIG